MEQLARTGCVLPPPRATSLILVSWSWRSEHTLSLHTRRGKSGPAFTIPCTTTRSVNHIGDSLWCLLILSSSLDACSSETLLHSPGLQETYLWEYWEGWIWILIYTKFIKIHGKADSPTSIHPLSLLTDAQGRKPGHQFKSAIFSWQEPHHYFIMTWHDPAVMYHMLYQSGAPPQWL